MKSREQSWIRLIVVIGVGISVPCLIFSLVLFNRKVRPLWLLTGKLKEFSTYYVYFPDGLAPGEKRPLVFALSPTGEPVDMISSWARVAEKHGWIVAASKEFRNGQDFFTLLRMVEAELTEVEQNSAIDTQRVIFTGLSGGGMGSHAFARYYPDRVTAIVINTGMMSEGLHTADYPQGKLVVFLASPTDFRYDEMKSDRIFLEAHHWKTDWIEFQGGHRMAPEAIYEQAAEWIEQNWPQ